MVQRICLVFLCCLPFGLMAQSFPDADSLNRLIRKTLNFLEAEQNKENIPGYQFKGEWPSEMRMRTGYILLGQHRAYDANCFSLAAIMNILAEAYLNDTTLTNIPPLLHRARPQLLSYADSNGFNFWPKMHPGGRLSWYKATNYSALVRRPVQFPIFNTYIRRAANIMNDNDDTAQGLLALMRYKQITGVGVPDYLQNLPFDNWRDTLRDNAHYYNIFSFDPYSSGAYLTWRGQEKAFPSWDLFLLAINNALFLTPLSTAYPKAYTPYMPYGANDVDAVVNANVLQYLALSGRPEKGIHSASKFIHQKVKRNRFSKAGVYYPNRYHVHHAVMKAYKQGAHTLKPSVDLLLKHLKESQLADGSYQSRRIVNKRDTDQSTLYALHAMLLADLEMQSQLKPNIIKAFHYLLQRISSSNDEACLDGGVYFSGGTVIRNTLYWCSDAYSTALFLHCLVMIRNQLSEPISPSDR